MNRIISITERKFKKNRLPKNKNHSFRTKVSILILSAVAVISLFLVVWPYLPKLFFMVFKPTINDTAYKNAAKATREGSTLNEETAERKSGNRLILSSIGVDTEIIDGNNINVIGRNQGVWRESRTIDPSSDGNIVIAGHRFLYAATNGGWFYNLPEMKNGDSIFIQWEGKTYEYEIYNSRTVLPTQIDIRDTDSQIQKKLTLYTCYPLGSTAERFVIEAKQI